MECHAYVSCRLRLTTGEEEELVLLLAAVLMILMECARFTLLSRYPDGAFRLLQPSEGVFSAEKGIHPGDRYEVCRLLAGLANFREQNSKY